jgi:hypothetical protein
LCTELLLQLLLQEQLHSGYSKALLNSRHICTCHQRKHQHQRHCWQQQPQHLGHLTCSSSSLTGSTFTSGAPRESSRPRATAYSSALNPAITSAWTSSSGGSSGNTVSQHQLP